VDGAKTSVATSSGVSSGVGNSSGVSKPSERDRLLGNEPHISTAPADNPVNPTAPPAESDEDNRATLSACTDRSAANPPEG